MTRRITHYTYPSELRQSCLVCVVAQLAAAIRAVGYRGKDGAERLDCWW